MIDRKYLRSLCGKDDDNVVEFFNYISDQGGMAPLLAELLDTHDKLLTYVDHAADCIKGKMYNSQSPPEKCDCGLDALLGEDVI